MDHFLVQILTFYSILLGANMLIAFLLWRGTGETLYKTSMMLWGASLLSFVLQDVFHQENGWTLFAFGSGVLTSLSFMRFANEVYGFKLSIRRWAQGSVLALAALLFLWFFTGQIFATALGISLVVALPQAWLVFRVFRVRKNRTVATRCFYVLLALNTLHLLDYPFLRFQIQGALWGYSVSFFLLVLMSIFIPAFIVKQVALRYQALLEQEVQARTEELRKVSDLNNALLNIVCHDLATPLTVLQVASGLLTKKDPHELSPRDMQKSREKIERSMAAIREILQQVRRLQSLRSGKEEIFLGGCDPVELVHEAMHLLEDQAQAKNIQFEFVNHLAGPVKFRVDPQLMKNQVLLNLLSNALKFSPPNSKVQILLTEDDQHGLIEICDRGIGIPPEILPHLFDFSAKTTRLGTQNEKGTGFGLPLVKTTLEMMQARIEVFSEASVEGSTGTKFLLHLQKSA